MGNVYKVVDNRSGLASKLAALARQLEEYPAEVFLELADIIVDASPVDTGTYMDNHHISDIGKRQYPKGQASSHGKPRRQAREPYADEALGRLAGEIDAMPIDGKWAYFTNTSAHADMVEGRYAPYGRAKSEFRSIVTTAWDRVNGNK